MGKQLQNSEEKWSIQLKLPVNLNRGTAAFCKQKQFAHSFSLALHGIQTHAIIFIFFLRNNNNFFSEEDYSL